MKQTHMLQMRGQITHKATSKTQEKSTNGQKLIRAKQKKISMLHCRLGDQDISCFLTVELFRIPKTTTPSAWLKQEHEKVTLTLNQPNLILTR
jgi:hypothetical protein